MADTVLQFGDPRAQTKWSAELALSAHASAMFTCQLEGKGANDDVERRTEPEEGPGDRVSFDLHAELTEPPVHGDTEVKGTEEDLSFFSDEVKIDQVRHPASAGGRMAREEDSPASARAGKPAPSAKPPVHLRNDRTIAAWQLHAARHSVKTQDRHLAAIRQFKAFVQSQGTSGPEPAGGSGPPVSESRLAVPLRLSLRRRSPDRSPPFMPPEPSARLVDQRIRNRIMEVVDLLAMGEGGVRLVGFTAFFELFYDWIPHHRDGPLPPNAALSDEERKCLEDLRRVLDKACDATPGEMGADEFIATRWPDRIAEAAAAALELLGRRGPAPEDTEESRFG